MFLRKKQNKSGSITVQIVDKSNGRWNIQTIGTSHDATEIERLRLKAKQIMKADQPGQSWLFPKIDDEDMLLENLMEQLSNNQIRTVGPELVFGTLFNNIGFSAVKSKIFRYLTIARLAFPLSKLKTIDYLRRYCGTKLSVDTIYRFMDKLNNCYKEQVSAIVYRHSKQRLGGAISFVFYDMTTLYFEAEDEDDLRKVGFSKDGKFRNPQIMLGLLVGQKGMPIGYDIFEGNTFEGHTLLPVLNRIESAYGFGKPVVVADAGLLSADNIKKLTQKKYPFIISARIKNETDKLKVKILKKAEDMVNGDSFVLRKKDGSRLIVNYSDKRARKDAYNRKRGIEKLRLQVKSGRLSKQSINNRGYNKFLRISGEARVSIDEEKIKTDDKWDGLKGYLTNTGLSAKDVSENYVQLWQIENAFRISKTDLKVRPVHHYLRRRIEAHICIAFVAYAIYKELEYQLKKHNIPISPRRAGELTHTMYGMEYTLPNSKEVKKRILKMDKEQQSLYNAICKP